MTILYVNTGTSANAGNGDSVRLAFTKVNHNFTEIIGDIAVLDSGGFTTVTVSTTVTSADIVSTGTAYLHNATFNGIVTGTTVFENILVENIATAYQFIGTNLNVTNAAFHDVFVSGGLFGNFFFDNLTITNTLTVGTLDAIQTINIGDYTIAQTNQYNDFSIIKNDINGLGFVLLNTQADSFSQVQWQDNISGGLSVVHQNSTNPSGNYGAGQNYIFGETPTDTINLGAYSDINIFANQANYNTPANTYNSPLVTVSSTNSEVTFNTTVTFTSDVFGIQQGGGFATTSTLVNNGNTLSLGADGTLTFPDSTVQTTAWTRQVVITQSPTAPATTSTSTLWYDTVGGRSYVYYDSEWVDASPTTVETFSLTTLQTIITTCTSFTEFKNAILGL
jgi:hypothetical protein